MTNRSTIRADLAAATALLTRLPAGPLGPPAPEAARGAWAWPLVGIVVGGLAGLAGLGVWAMGATPAVAAAVVIASQMALTGALHEDGLADTADGLWGGRDRARRLEIMRDSRIGTYGTAALTLSILLRWSLIATALIQGNLVGVVLTAAVVSRAPMAVLMRWLPAARDDGLSRGAGVPGPGAAQAGVGLAILALLPWGGHGLAAAILAVLALWAVGRLARARLGGQTGDVLGASQQLSEVAVLAALTAA